MATADASFEEFFQALALVSFAALTRAFGTTERPAGESPPLMPTGMVITFTGDDPRGIGDLVAWDPDTGEVRTIAAAADAIVRAAYDPHDTLAQPRWRRR